MWKPHKWRIRNGIRKFSWARKRAGGNWNWSARKGSRHPQGKNDW